MKHEDSDSVFNSHSFDKDTLVMKVDGKPTCDVCHEKVHETFGVEDENTSYITLELCIMCFSHKFGTQNAVNLQQVADAKRRTYANF